MGKHKFCLVFSPHKSSEGAIFGIIFSILSVLILKWIYASYLTYGHVLLLGLVLGIIGQLGDLIESLCKRDMGVKDTSKILPGHGGILDRFDASFLTIPATYYYLKYLVF